MVENSPETELAGMVTVTAVFCPASNVHGWKSATRQPHDERTRSRCTVDSPVFLTTNIRDWSCQAENFQRPVEMGDTDNGWADASRNANAVKRTGRIARGWHVLQYVVSFNIAIQGLCQFSKMPFRKVS